MQVVHNFISSAETFIANNPKEASVIGIFITIGSKFLELFNELHIPDVVIPSLQVLVLATSLILGIKGLIKKNKKKNNG